jgi:hypothetical protein
VKWSNPPFSTIEALNRLSQVLKKVNSIPTADWSTLKLIKAELKGYFSVTQPMKCLLSARTTPTIIIPIINQTKASPINPPIIINPPTGTSLPIPQS